MKIFECAGQAEEGAFCVEVALLEGVTDEDVVEELDALLQARDLHPQHCVIREVLLSRNDQERTEL